jgi:hypothetical protein
MSELRYPNQADYKCQGDSDEGACVLHTDLGE